MIFCAIETYLRTYIMYVCVLCLDISGAVHTVRGSARVRDTLRARIELVESNDDVHTRACPHRTQCEQPFMAVKLSKQSGF